MVQHDNLHDGPGPGYRKFLRLAARGISILILTAWFFSITPERVKIYFWCFQYLLHSVSGDRNKWCRRFLHNLHLRFIICGSKWIRFFCHFSFRWLINNTFFVCLFSITIITISKWIKLTGICTITVLSCSSTF